MAPPVPPLGGAAPADWPQARGSVSFRGTQRSEQGEQDWPFRSLEKRGLDSNLCEQMAGTQKMPRRERRKERTAGTALIRQGPLLAGKRAHFSSGCRVPKRGIFPGKTIDGRS